MTLPLISYGGSSIIVVMSMMGILMSIWSGRKVK
jgi:cell division protein FtsW (lipid II flippase)